MRWIPVGACRVSLLLPLLFLASVVVSASHTDEPAEDPMVSEILTHLEQSRNDIAALHARFRAANDEAEALAIQQLIGERTQRAEIGVLEIEHRFAISRGQVHVAERLDQAIRRMKDSPAREFLAGGREDGR